MTSGEGFYKKPEKTNKISETASQLSQNKGLDQSDNQNQFGLSHHQIYGQKNISSVQQSSQIELLSPIQNNKKIRHFNSQKTEQDVDEAIKMLNVQDKNQQQLENDIQNKRLKRIQIQNGFQNSENSSQTLENQLGQGTQLTKEELLDLALERHIKEHFQKPSEAELKWEQLEKKWPKYQMELKQQMEQIKILIEKVDKLEEQQNLKKINEENYFQDNYIEEDNDFQFQPLAKQYKLDQYEENRKKDIQLKKKRVQLFNKIYKRLFAKKKVGMVFAQTQVQLYKDLLNKIKDSVKNMKQDQENKEGEMYKQSITESLKELQMISNFHDSHFSMLSIIYKHQKKFNPNKKWEEIISKYDGIMSNSLQEVYNKMKMKQNNQEQFDQENLKNYFNEFQKQYREVYFRKLINIAKEGDIELLRITKAMFIGGHSDDYEDDSIKDLYEIIAETFLENKVNPYEQQYDLYKNAQFMNVFEQQRIQKMEEKMNKQGGNVIPQKVPIKETDLLKSQSRIEGQKENLPQSQQLNKRRQFINSQDHTQKQNHLSNRIASFDQNLKKNGSGLSNQITSHEKNIQEIQPNTSKRLASFERLCPINFKTTDFFQEQEKNQLFKKLQDIKNDADRFIRDYQYPNEFNKNYPVSTQFTQDVKFMNTYNLMPFSTTHNLNFQQKNNQETTYQQPQYEQIEESPKNKSQLRQVINCQDFKQLEKRAQSIIKEYGYFSNKQSLAKEKNKPVTLRSFKSNQQLDYQSDKKEDKKLIKQMDIQNQIDKKIQSQKKYSQKNSQVNIMQLDSNNSSVYSDEKDFSQIQQENQQFISQNNLQTNRKLSNNDSHHKNYKQQYQDSDNSSESNKSQGYNFQLGIPTLEEQQRQYRENFSSINFTTQQNKKKINPQSDQQKLDLAQQKMLKVDQQIFSTKQKKYNNFRITKSDIQQKFIQQKKQEINNLRMKLIKKQQKNQFEDANKKYDFLEQLEQFKNKQEEEEEEKLQQQKLRRQKQEEQKQYDEIMKKAQKQIQF
ncbi:hypothetical protein PPERSA_12965 [Pseudocohnilembus persalinus]|uniref:Uncharacterized protein n=1 Tax=Pseudocohnilembus persalinus TaxID=266149 RepID=A0A0V0R1S6_PSEPJ|nr:hypothetical protein PPERSA_12965 [Pseudocohnilembus persalinus]|eukprot:KRX08484.1 hypothetical protein PPERSA_12965 [Pseudocohnilembus persalinus]